MKQHFYGRAKLVAMCVLAATVGACGNLNRDAAADMIRSSAQIKELTTRLQIHDNKISDGEKQGLWRASGKMSKYGNTWFARRFSFGGEMRPRITYVELVTPVALPKIEIAGIAEESPSVRVAEFTWQHEALPTPIIRFAKHRGSGKGKFRKFDDGWRLEAVDLSYSNDIATLSAVEQELVDRDIKARQQYIKQSLEPSKQIYAFQHYYSVKDGSEVTGTITDVGINFTRAPDFCMGCFAESKFVGFSTLDGPKMETRTRPAYRDFMLNIGSGSSGNTMYFIDELERDKVKMLLAAAIQEWRTKYWDLIEQ